MPVVLGPLVCGQLGMATSSYEDNKHLALLPPRAALSANDTADGKGRSSEGPCVWQTFGPPSGETPICKNSLDCLSPQGLGAVRAEDFL